MSVSTGLEADCVDAGIDLPDAEKLLDLVSRVAVGHIDGFAAKGSGLGQAILIEIPHDDHRGPQQLGAGRRGKPHGTGPGNIDGGPDADTCRDGVLKHLIAVSRDFAASMAEDPSAADLRVKIHDFGTGPFAGTNAKIKNTYLVKDGAA